jgi:hypothetical protein
MIPLASSWFMTCSPNNIQYPEMPPRAGSSLLMFGSLKQSGLLVGLDQEKKKKSKTTKTVNIIMGNTPPVNRTVRRVVVEQQKLENSKKTDVLLSSLREHHLEHCPDPILFE